MVSLADLAVVKCGRGGYCHQSWVDKRRNEKVVVVAAFALDIALGCIIDGLLQLGYLLGGWIGLPFGGYGNEAVSSGSIEIV